MQASQQLTAADSDILKAALGLRILSLRGFWGQLVPVAWLFILRWHDWLNSELRVAITQTKLGCALALQAP